MSTEQVRRAWQRIEGWLAEHAPPLARDLAPPADDRAIASLEATLGVGLPEDLADSLRLHDGQGHLGVAALGRWRALSCAQIIELAEENAELVASGSPLHDDGVIADPGVKARWWHQRWIPFAVDGGGDALIVDADPDEDGAVGQIVRFRHDAETRRRAAPSLAEWLEQLADEMERGDWTAVYGGESLRATRKPASR